MKPEVNPPRRYESPQRQEAARETRTAILAAARELFLAQGYAATRMPMIAAAARVNVDTIYSSIGRKPDLVRLLLETAISGAEEPVPAPQRVYVQEIQAEPDARRKLVRYARAVREIQARLTPMVAVLREAAIGEPALAELWASISQRRAENMRLFAAELLATGSLREGLEVEAVADIIWATNGPEFYSLLVIERGWDAARFEAWLADAWARLLLASDEA